MEWGSEGSGLGVRAAAWASELREPSGPCDRVGKGQGRLPGSLATRNALYRG